MADYKPGEVAALLGVSVDTVRRLADSGRLPTRRSGEGHRVVPGEDLARYLAEQDEPDDAGPIVGASARNRFTGIVTRVRKDEVMAQVDIQAGPHRVVSLMSREAVDELGLAPGVLATAVVKSTNVVVELPRAD